MQVLNTNADLKIKVNTPPCPKGLEVYGIELEGIWLTVHLEYEPEERGSYQGGLQMEPDYPECVSIHAVYADSHVNIVRLLSEELIEEIQATYLHDLSIESEGDDYGY
jgi:hypothetical protein